MARSASSRKSPAERFGHINYSTVGIDPVTFYAGKFAGGAGTTNYLANPLAEIDIEFDRARFLAANIDGPSILDVGCGSAPYAATLRASAKAAKITGLDLDPACVAVASQVYDEALQFELGKPLPFADSQFDTVFSCDVFGHIEFSQKNSIIAEIARITKKKGKSVHVIESGNLNYDAIDHSNPDDPIKKYIWMEGHIGVEDARALKERWSKFFKSVQIENAFLYPFGTVDTIKADPSISPEVKSYFDNLLPAERQAAHAALGYVSNKMKSHFRKSEAGLLFPDSESGNPIQMPSGLAYLVARDPII